MSDVLQVSTTTGSQDEARRLVHGAVQAQLAASGQIIGPVESAYWHAGEFGTGQEWQVLLKSTRAQYERLEALLKELHEWQNPEITAVAIEVGAAPYIRWVHTTVDNAGESRPSTDR